MKPLHMFKRWQTVALLIAFTMLGLGVGTLTASAETAIITGNSVYVRSGPGTSYGSIGSLSRNASINILERQGGWVKISFGNTTGWVAEYLTSQSPSKVQLAPQIFLNGNLITFEVNPISVNGYTLVPLREILEKLGATVTWDDKGQTITARKSATTIILTIGSPTATINGQVHNLDVPAQIVEGHTLAPLSFAVEALGGKTIWDQENQVINVYCPSDPRDQLTAVSITTADLNIRSGPSTSEDIVGMAPYGSILAYVAEKDGWYQVKYQGQLGWVASWLVIPLWNTSVPASGKETLLPVPSDHQAFVQQMKPYAETASKGTSLPVNFLLAQWAEESGYGTSSLAQYYNNFGGIKDPDTGGFKKYTTPDEFAQDVIAIYTQNSKFNQLLAHARAGVSIKTLFNDLTNCHYASSSTYGEKIRTQYLPEIDSALGNM